MLRVGGSHLRPRSRDRRCGGSEGSPTAAGRRASDGDGCRSRRTDPNRVRRFAGRSSSAVTATNRPNPNAPGGVYLLRGGKAIRVPGSPPHVYGLAAAKSALYVSTASRFSRAAAGTDVISYEHASSGLRTATGHSEGWLSGPAVMIYVERIPSALLHRDLNASEPFLSVYPATGAARIKKIAIGLRQPWQLRSSCPVTHSHSSRI